MKKSLSPNKKYREIKIKQELLPRVCGCYIFRGLKNEVLYVGKAVNLRSRVSQYFKNESFTRPKIGPLMLQVTNIEHIETENEIEALILETNLIKKYRPKYNSLMKDDKSGVYIYISTHEEYPKIFKVRKKTPDAKGKYFGPYTNVGAIDKTLNFLRKVYPFANCAKQLTSKKKFLKSRVCLYYHLGECPGPCDQLISPKKYRENINKIIDFLNGKNKNIVRNMEEKMQLLSEQEKFEHAAILRDKISSIKYLSQKIYLDSGDTEEEFLKINKERAARNVYLLFKRLKALVPSEKINKFTALKAKIECYDISNLQGKEAVGSMTVSVGGILQKDLYRIFNIKTIDQPNDVGMMEETIRRRLRYLEIPDAKDKSFNTMPDLIVLDGGKTQLITIAKLLRDMSFLNKIVLISIAKKEEIIWYIDVFSSLEDPVFRHLKISKEKPELQLIQRMRDEAHRFGITRHRKIHQKQSKVSVLDSIKGVGPKTKKKLLQHFGSIAEIRKSSLKNIYLVVKKKVIAKRIKESVLKNIEISALNS